LIAIIHASSAAICIADDRNFSMNFDLNGFSSMSLSYRKNMVNGGFMFIKTVSNEDQIAFLKKGFSVHDCWVQARIDDYPPYSEKWGCSVFSSPFKKKELTVSVSSRSIKFESGIMHLDNFKTNMYNLLKYSKRHK
jgi:hypothetical protein